MRARRDSRHACFTRRAAAAASATTRSSFPTARRARRPRSSPADKDAISHRGTGFRALAAELAGAVRLARVLVGAGVALAEAAETGAGSGWRSLVGVGVGVGVTVGGLVTGTDVLTGTTWWKLAPTISTTPLVARRVLDQRPTRARR